MPVSTANAKAPSRTYRGIALLWVLWAAFAVLLLYGSFALFCALKFQINDHGIYTNFLWNSAHGAPFRYLLSSSYLGVHLSYTLLLIAPLFHLWDHPFLLCVVQWGLGVGGSLLTAWIARRAGLGPRVAACFALFQLAYPFTQAVLLCDFHGVCLYYVLFPWLFGCLVFRRHLAWIPLLLIAGLREEAALLVVPMLVWFAVRERWRAGWWLAGAAVAYAVFAMAVLFPWINGEALHASRSDYVGAKAVAAGFNTDGIVSRVVALFWFFLPAVLVARGRAWRPILWLPSVALIIPMCSGVPRINSLEVMYSAAPFTLLVLALLEAARRGEGMPSAGRLSSSLGCVTLAAVLLIDLVGPHEHGERMPRVWKLDPTGLATLRASRAIPPEGILFTSRTLAGITAARRDLMIMRDGATLEQAEQVRHVFIENETLARSSMSYWVDQLASGQMGVVYSDHFVSLFTLGAATNRNAELLHVVRNPGRTLPLSRTKAKCDDNLYLPARGAVRHWSAIPTGTPSIVKAPIDLSIEAGSYRGHLLYRAGPMPAGGDPGVMTLVVGATGQEVMRVPLTNAPGDFAWQAFDFTFPQRTHLGITIRGGRQPLWLDRLLVSPAAPSR